MLILSLKSLQQKRVFSIVGALSRTATTVKTFVASGWSLHFLSFKRCRIASAVLVAKVLGSITSNLLNSSRAVSSYTLMSIMVSVLKVNNGRFSNQAVKRYVRHKVAYNVLHIGAVGDLKHESLNYHYISLDAECLINR